jgi:Family of unknown function (DUF6178)
MSEDQKNSKILQRVLELQEKRREILELPPKKALDRILDDPRPAALVRSFPEQDFYFLVNEIGPEDSLPLLSLAADRQWEHLVDIEAWQKDQLDLNTTTRWLSLLQEADPSRFTQWFLEEQLEFVELYLFKNIEVRTREHDQDPSDFGDEFVTLDDTYYYKFIDIPAGSESEKITDAQRRAFINRLVQNLAALEFNALPGVLLEAAHIIPAETQEDCYRFRSVRLAEKGFLPFDEAIGLYQPMKPGEVESRPKKFIPRSSKQISSLPVPIAPLRELKEDNHFTRALQKIEAANVLQQIQTEFANLCNQIIVADHKTIGEREALKTIVNKAGGYISIGLERLARDKKVDPARSAALIAAYPLQNIFRAGFGAALELKWRAEKWLSKCWFARADLRLTFWGEKWMGVMGGLLVKKPLFYDNYKSGVLYREFATLDDIRTSEMIFDQVVAVDDLLALMNIKMDSAARYGFLTYKNLLLTQWARHYLRLKGEKLRALTLKQFLPFFEKLLPESMDTVSRAARTIPVAMKTSFLNWLAAESGLKDYEISDRMGQTFEDLFNEIESEYGMVAAADMDPRFVHFFMIRKEN